MKVADADILFIPGFGGSGPDHWQSRWEQKLSSARRLGGIDFESRDPRVWTEAIKSEIDSAEKPVVLVAHSLGVAGAVAASKAATGRVAGGFFVAPPDFSSERAKEMELGDFGPYPRLPLAFPSFVLASRNDPFGTYDHAGDLANAWGAFLLDCGEAGHINAESGQGPWPEGTMVFAQFLSRLKP